MPAPSASVRLSVIVPAYDEAPHAREHLRRIAAAVEGLGRPFEILLVDDGSRDGTADEAERLAAEDPRVRVLRHPSNQGKGAALATGCRAARGDVLVFLDADLDVGPEHIGPLLARMEAQGAAVGVGSKYLPGARQRRPLHRAALSRLYLAVTSVLFRLPIRDTQTGLKAVRASLARAVVPAIVARRWAWDVELLLLAHRLGAGIAAVPVAVDFHARGTRLGLRGLLRSGIDTLATFLRDRGLAAYGRALAAARPARAAPRPRALLAGDDLGLSDGVDDGCVAAASEGRLTTVSWIATGPTAARAAARWRAAAPPAALGVHLDLARCRLPLFLLRGWLGLVPAREVRAAVREQVGLARSLGLGPVRVDAHRHAFLPPAVYRAVAREARALGLAGIRRPAPAGALRCGPGLAGRAKALLMLAAAWCSRAVPRAHGLDAPEGVADAAVVAGWAARGRWPRALARATVEVVSHPASGLEGLPPAERGPDRRADQDLLLRLRRDLEGLGVEVVVPGAAVQGPCLPASESPWTSPSSSPS